MGIFWTRAGTTGLASRSKENSVQVGPDADVLNVHRKEGVEHGPEVGRIDDGELLIMQRLAADLGNIDKLFFN